MGASVSTIGCLQRYYIITIISFYYRYHKKKTDGEFSPRIFYILCCAKEAKGDCCVPQFYPANTSLGIWVDAQRVRQRNGKLSQERIDRLNTVGFTWSVKKKNETSPGECNDKNQKMQSDDDSLKS